MNLAIKYNDIQKKPLNDFSENKVKIIMDFLDKNYEIMINCFDRTKSIIKSKDPKRYKFNPTFDDISIHIFNEGLRCSDTLLRKILRSRNYTKTYNPITDYFNNLKGKYNGKSHIDILASHLRAHDFGDKKKGYYQERLHKLLKKWLVATAACALGKQFNPVALGLIHHEEGIGKSFFFEFIVPDQLKEYHTEYDPEKMDMTDLFAKNLLVVFDELRGINARTAEQFKNALQKKEITVYHPRDPFPEIMPRIASACFTTNRSSELGGFITPHLGYRRFGCIQLSNINHDYSKIIDIDQLWAEAIMLMEGGYEYQFTLKDFREYNEYNSRLIIETPAMKLVRIFYTIPENGEGEWKQASDIYMELIKARKIKSDVVDKVNATAIGYALKHLNFERKSIRVPDMGTRYMYNIISLI